MERTGSGGELICAGRRAAMLGDWHLSDYGGGSWAIEAQVLEADDFWLASGRRFSLRLRMVGADWYWPETLSVSGVVEGRIGIGVSEKSNQRRIEVWESGVSSVERRQSWN